MSSPSAGGPVRAAGVVLVRGGSHGRETLVIHRAHRADWSLPKGKVEPGEHVLTTAVRECDEETGVVPILGARLATQTYVALGEPKIVDYWVARIGSDQGFAPDDEVDEIRWMTARQAHAQLTYPRDADLVDAALAMPDTTPLIVLRHTQALRRTAFNGQHDADRPLSGRGRSQAKAVVPLLAAYGITAVHSSDAVRCRETVRYFAESVGATVENEPSLSEEGHERARRDSRTRILELAAMRVPVVVCTHRPVLPTIVQALATLPGGDKHADSFDPRLPPGGCLVVHRSFDDATDDSVNGADNGAEVAAPRVIAVERHEL